MSATIYESYDQIHKRGPIIMQRGFQGMVAYVVGYDEAKTVLGDHKRFIKDINRLRPDAMRPAPDAEPDLFSLVYDNMLNTDRPDHTRLRNLVSKAFTPAHIQALAPRIQAIADELIDGFIDQGHTELIESFAFPLPITVICELLGVPADDRDHFRRWSHAFLGIAYDQRSYEQSLREFVGYIGRKIAERRAEPRDDLISGLVHAEEDGQKLNEQEMYSMISLLIVAGHETTVNLIGNGMLALLQHPDQEARLRRDPDLIDAAIEELLRYCGPVEMATTRYAVEDLILGGQKIQRGTPLVVILAAADRDPVNFAVPKQLDISREGNKHMAFGYGIHYCLGAPLARLEAKIAFTTLLQRLPHIQLAMPKSDIEYNQSSIVRGLTRLPIRWS